MSEVASSALPIRAVLGAMVAGVFVPGIPAAQLNVPASTAAPGVTNAQTLVDYVAMGPSLVPVSKYGVFPSTTLIQTAAIQAMFTAAAADGVVPLFPAGAFRYDANLTCACGIVMQPGGVLRAVDPENQRILGGSNTLWRDITVMSETGSITTNDATENSCFLLFADVSNIQIERLNCLRSRGGLVLFRNVHTARVVLSRAKNMGKDAFHTTGGSRDIVFEDCEVENGGDDGFACIGYAVHGDRPSRVYYKNCHVRGVRNGRNWGIVGGDTVELEGCSSTALPAIQQTKVGATTNGSAVVTFTGGVVVGNLRVGQVVSGTGIPFTPQPTRILSIDSSTQITLNANAQATGTPTLTFVGRSDLESADYVGTTSGLYVVSESGFNSFPNTNIKVRRHLVRDAGRGAGRHAVQVFGRSGQVSENIDIECTVENSNGIAVNIDGGTANGLQVVKFRGSIVNTTDPLGLSGVRGAGPFDALQIANTRDFDIEYSTKNAGKCAGLILATVTGVGRFWVKSNEACINNASDVLGTGYPAMTELDLKLHVIAQTAPIDKLIEGIPSGNTKWALTVDDYTTSADKLSGQYLNQISPMPASTVAWANPCKYPICVRVYNGTITLVDIATTDQVGTAIWVPQKTPVGVNKLQTYYMLQPGQSIRFTYTVAPSAQWFPCVT